MYTFSSNDCKKIYGVVNIVEMAQIITGNKWYFLGLVTQFKNILFYRLKNFILSPLRCLKTNLRHPPNVKNLTIVMNRTIVELFVFYGHESWKIRMWKLMQFALHPTPTPRKWYLDQWWLKYEFKLKKSYISGDHSGKSIFRRT